MFDPETELALLELTPAEHELFMYHHMSVAMDGGHKTVTIGGKDWHICWLEGACDYEPYSEPKSNIL